MSSLVGTYGVSGHGPGIVPLICLEYQGSEVVFTYYWQTEKSDYDREIADWSEFFDFHNRETLVAIAISALKYREALAKKVRRCSNSSDRSLRCIG